MKYLKILSGVSTRDCQPCYVSVQDAALEKRRAGEGRNVEHVALGDDFTVKAAEEVVTPSAKRTRRRT